MHSAATFDDGYYEKPCTPDDIARIAAQKPTHNTHCPNNWRQLLYVASTASLPRHPHGYNAKTRHLNAQSVHIIHVGCNKGDDLVDHMNLFTNDSLYNVTAFREKTKAHGMRLDRACPDKRGMVAPKENDADSSAHWRTKVYGHCIEPMTNTFDIVNKTLFELKYDNVKAYRLAASSQPGSVMFPDYPAPGAESLGIGSEPKHGATPTDVVTLDQFTHVNNINNIHVLSIDTEGNDARVIIGAISSLPHVRYLEFEYHEVNHWSRSDLQDTTDLLNNLGFTCYWTGNEGQLWKLTNCWHDSYYDEKRWSNISCCNRAFGDLCSYMSANAS